MSPARFAALCRAWHRKSRRPVPAMTVDFMPDFFDTPSEDDPNGQKKLMAAIPKA